MIRRTARVQASRDILSGELPLAFERVRTQLAIAIAAEAKWTTLERKKYYLETADAEELTGHPEYYRALRTIRQLPVQERALRLCQILRDIMPESGGLRHRSGVNHCALLSQ